MGRGLRAAGAKGTRMALRSATIHGEPARGGFWGSGPDVEIQARELLRSLGMPFRLTAKVAS